MDKDEEITKIEIENRKWKNRRYITYGFCFFILGLTCILIFGLPLETVKGLQQVLGWIYMGSFSIIGSYFGLSTWADIKAKM